MQPASPCPIHLGMIRDRESLGPASPGPAGRRVLHPIAWVLNPRSGWLWGPASISVDPALCRQLGIRIIPWVLHPMGWLRLGVKPDSCNSLLCISHINTVWGRTLGLAPSFPGPTAAGPPGDAPWVLNPGVSST